MDLLAVDIGNSFLGSGSFLKKTTDIGTLVSLFLSNSIIIAGVILLVTLIFAGYTMMGAHGDPQKLAGAMKTVTYAVMGFLLVFATFFIIRIIETMTGLNILQ